jgi:hypothetical protein
MGRFKVPSFARQSVPLQDRCLFSWPSITARWRPEFVRADDGTGPYLFANLRGVVDGVARHRGLILYRLLLLVILGSLTGFDVPPSRNFCLVVVGRRRVLVKKKHYCVTGPRGY